MCVCILIRSYKYILISEIKSCPFAFELQIIPKMVFALLITQDQTLLKSNVANAGDDSKVG